MKAKSMKKGCRVRVKGKVQNVGFRFYTVKKAMEFNISGYVKNETDGSVYFEAEGEEDALETFLHWCRQGPQWARVDGFELNYQPVMDYSGFQIR